MQPTYNFPVLRGIQAGREYYLAMCPLKLVPKLFLYDEVAVPPELRAQRTLNKARVPEIASYITDHPQEYVFSAITASIDSDVEFTALRESGPERNIGTIAIPMDATIIINDGQHRRAAIEAALAERPELADESIAVVFFLDSGLTRSQQMFADLNKHAIRPSQSLGILYDHRDPVADLSRHLMLHVPVFKGFTEREKTTISNRSQKLFTLSGIYQANQALLRHSGDEPIPDEDRDLAVAYWSELGEAIPEWKLAIRKEVSCAVLRDEYIHAHGVALLALGKVGAALLAEHPEDWPARLERIGSLDWSRSNTELWEGRAMLQGRISKAKRQVGLTVNLIKQHLDLALRPDEQRLETMYMTDESED